MLDLGFIWFFIKSMRDPFLIVMWVFCALQATSDSVPNSTYKTVCGAIAIVGFTYVWTKLTISLIKDKYKEYQAQQEAAWNILKDNK